MADLTVRRCYVIVASISTNQRLVQAVPVIGSRYPRLHFGSNSPAEVTVGHDCDSIALSYMREKVACKSPVAPAVAEVPAFAVFCYLEADGIRPKENQDGSK
jgi:hypothetical protein